MNPYTFIKDTRREYLDFLAAGGLEPTLYIPPHESSGAIKVYDSDLGNCPKKAALSRNHVEPTHPRLARLSLGDMHRMRSGVVAEREWIATMLVENGVQWHVNYGERINDAHTRGKMDIVLDFRGNDHFSGKPFEKPEIDGTLYDTVIIEIKRTDGDLKDSYLYQLCSYLEKFFRLHYNDNRNVLGKLILDHRHTIKEYTVIPVKTVDLEWQVYDEDGREVQRLHAAQLTEVIQRHTYWMNRIVGEPDNPHSIPPRGYDSPLHSWECHQDWRKREGKARFRCPFAGYCFGIASEEFDVHNEKQGNKIIARVIVDDDGVEYRYEEPG